MVHSLMKQKKKQKKEKKKKKKCLNGLKHGLITHSNNTLFPHDVFGPQYAHFLTDMVTVTLNCVKKKKIDL